MIQSLADTFCGLLGDEEKKYVDFAEELPHVSYNESFREEWKKMNQKAVEGIEKHRCTNIYPFLSMHWEKD